MDCSIYRETICNRILPNGATTPKYMILHGNRAYEWNFPLDYVAVRNYMDDLGFLEDSKVRSNKLKKLE